MYKHIDEIVASYDKIVAWGAGNYFERYYGLLAERISYIVDKDSRKHGNEKCGFRVYSPEKLREENPKTCLILVFCSAYEGVFCDIEEYGDFDALSIYTYQTLCSLQHSEWDFNIGQQENLILICAGMEALWQTNGSNKFITNQNRILHQEGFQTVEIAPISYHTKYTQRKGSMAVRYDSKFAGIVSLEEFIQKCRKFHGVIIHSLYREPWILEPLLSQIMVKTRILYYLHDFYAVCENRFLYRNGKACLEEKHFNCESCGEYKTQKEHAAYHDKLFKKFQVVLAAPSESTARIAKKVFGDIQIDVLPHLGYAVRESAGKERKVRNIAYVGAAIELKGWKKFCGLQIKLKDKYELFCLGKCNENLKIEGVTYIDNIGNDRQKNEISMVEGLKKYDIDLAYIGSIWPETYSYTYYEAFEAGCFVIAFGESGNVADQIGINRNGKVFQSVSDMAEWLLDEQEVNRTVNGNVKYIEHVQDSSKFLEYFRD